MRSIHLTDDLKLRFPARSEEFNEGVEIGAMAVLMALDLREVTQWVSTANVEQARSLAEKMRYRLTIEATDGDSTKITLRQVSVPPKLKVVRG